MKASILVHNFNRDSALSRCLSSVVKQTYRPLEAVILDAGSTDDSPEVIARAIEEMRRVGIEAKCVNCPQMGVAASRNFASAHASGALLCYIDNDAAFSSAESVSEFTQLFTMNRKLALVSFRVLDGDTDKIDPFAWVFRRSTYWSDMQFRTFSFAGAAFCVRRCAFLEAGGFWDHLRYAREEEDLGMILIDKGWDLIYSPAVTVRHYKDSRSRAGLFQRRAMELRNGILVLWRRVPIPLSLAAIGGRICSMGLKASREGMPPGSILRAIPQAIREWHELHLERNPISLRGAWKYTLLHFSDGRR